MKTLITPNLSTFDRIFRIVVASVLAILFFYGVVTGAAALVLLLAVTIFTSTSIINSCPVYSFLGIKRWEKRSTHKKEGMKINGAGDGMLKKK